jgi:hypothetical protein
MFLQKRLFSAAFIFILIGFAAFSASAQKRVMWEPVNIGARDLYWGPGGEKMQPVLERWQSVQRQEGGTSIKYRIKDGEGNEWIMKIGRETQPETAAVRLLWAIGYKTEINYLVPKISIPNVGNHKNVRFEARPEKVKRLESWKWMDNPFAGTRELDGLKLMMAMFNNWDLKDENTVILQTGDEHHYVISDLGAAFGKLSKVEGGRTGRSVNDPKDFAQSKFIKQVNDGVIVLDYRGVQDSLMTGIKVENGRWLADLLLQLSDKQIEDAFRAANYEEDEIKTFARAFKARINELDLATKPATNVAEK